MGTILVSVILAAAVAGIIRGMIRDKKNGKSPTCGGDCKHCGGSCSYLHHEEIQKNSD